MAAIEAYQGRTMYISVSIVSNGEPYILKNGETIRFGVKSLSDDYIIFKKLTSADEFEGKYPFIITAEDLELPTGRYKYDVSVELSDGSCHILKPTDNFILKRSITFKGDDLNA